MLDAQNSKYSLADLKKIVVKTDVLGINFSFSGPLDNFSLIGYDQYLNTIK